MLHLAYSGQMLEEGGGFALESSLRSWYVVGNPLKLHTYSYIFIVYNVFVKFFVNSINTVTHYMTGRYGVFVEDM